MPLEQKKTFVEPILHEEASLADATLVSGGSEGSYGGSGGGRGRRRGRGRGSRSISSISSISRD
jgi:hypothetical protein